jgi:vacuolar-type H+-ATPase subunit E/Vma4
MKLNKTQIEAIATKAVRDIRTAFEAKCEKARESYSPSEAYLHAKELFNKKEALENQLNEVDEELRKIRKIYDVGGWCCDETLLNVIMESDLKISSPKFSNITEDIKTDLTIGTIDSSFDPYKFIEETVNKYVNS